MNLSRFVAILMVVCFMTVGLSACSGGGSISGSGEGGASGSGQVSGSQNE